MRKILLPMLLVSCHSLVAAQLTTVDFIQSIKHKHHQHQHQHQHQLSSTLTPTMTLSRTEAWNLAGNPNLFTKIDAVTFYDHTDAVTGRCSGAGRTLDLSHSNFLDTGITLNGPAGDLTPIAIHTSGIIAAASTLGYTIPSNGQGCAKVSMSYQAGPATLIPNKLNASISPQSFEYAHIQSLGGNIITGGTPVNNQASLLKNATLVLNRTAHAQCWGNNNRGQLGDGTQSDSNVPVNVAAALGNGVVKISSGRSHSCALLKTGAVKCWGQNQYGQLGNNTTADSLLPVAVTGLSSGVTDIASGRESVCALLNTGGVKCWGQNLFWQLGDGTRTNRLAPTDVSGLTSGVTSIATGYIHACALLKTGQIKCWGEGLSGQLGDNSIEARKTPVFVANIGGDHPEATAIAAGSQSTCAIVNKGGFLANGDIECWGGNSYGQLGDGTTTKRLLPTQVQGLEKGATAISMGTQHSCAIVNGGMKCWGDNRKGQLGIGPQRTTFTTPQNVSSLTNGIKTISATNFHSCAVNAYGRLQCWGQNNKGQLGIGITTTSANYYAPITVHSLLPGSTEAISEGNNSTFHCAASNSAGVNSTQLDATANTISLNNIGYSASSFTVADASARGIISHCGTALDPLAQCDLTYDGSSSRGNGAILVTDASAKAHVFPFHIQKSGTGVCWGSNNFGQLGDLTTTNRNTPTNIDDLPEAKQIVTGHHHACALLTTGSVMCWGDNTHGQLGIPRGSRVKFPKYVPTLKTSSNVVSLTAGADHTCALLNSGKVECWGKNQSGQIGDGSTADRREPVNVTGLSMTATALVSGSNHTCALLKNGRMQCWGSNEHGQLGDSSFTNRLQPTAVSDLSNDSVHVVAMSAGQETSCALLSDGGMKCWGKNGDGQLGIGHTSNAEAKPQQVLGLTTGVAAISVGGMHTCAMLQNGSEDCWGLNNKGQLGIGSAAVRKASPQPVPLGNNIVAISTGKLNSCAMLDDGNVSCWGKNVDGQLGNGTLNDSSIPKQVSQLSNTNELSTSSGDSAFNCAIHS
ncbi:MAG: hypothetical protein P1U63_01250 [Coxiellaceae bacterium]|nr:hypothetical protein [Coxiellaceae bacterium]